MGFSSIYTGSSVYATLSRSYTVLHATRFFFGRFYIPIGFLKYTVFMEKFELGIRDKISGPNNSVARGIGVLHIMETTYEYKFFSDQSLVLPHHILP